MHYVMDGTVQKTYRLNDEKLRSMDLVFDKSQQDDATHVDAFRQVGNCRQN